MGWIRGKTTKLDLEKNRRNQWHAAAPRQKTDDELDSLGVLHVEDIAKPSLRISSIAEQIPVIQKPQGDRNVVGDLIEALFGKQVTPTKMPVASNGDWTWSFQSRPLVDEGLDDEALPFISKEEVMSARSNGQTGDATQKLWIVVDGIVYDCSTFIDDHPGGQQVILSFVGKDCSWQFWRFHSKNDMQQYGRALRVGRTKNADNEFEERPKYVGLMSIGTDECA